MYKDTKWAKEILAQQDENGLWGNFHTLSKPSKAPITTEQALRRPYVLGFDINDEAIARTVTYMSDCLKGRKQMPDRREKMHNWDIFTELMLAVWIRKFTLADRSANRVAGKWADIITRAFSSGSFSHEDCALAYTEIFGEPPRGGRLLDFVTFYQLSLLPGMLNERTERLMMDYVLHYDKGIYYVFSRPSGDSRICNVPETFTSREAGRYLAALELLAEYRNSIDMLHFASKWLYANQREEGNWDMGSEVKDGIYFPLSDNWKKKENRIADCTWRIRRLLDKLEDRN
ncbi:MAG: hypothetical protein E6177_07205 [Clostridium sp.]|uniref:hypothetical protein n=1 Tax=Eisenbergiella porci TaxID=2652274 RepID=UPI00290D22E4|nr:hypothetical protein [Clostridium sp.]